MKSFFKTLRPYAVAITALFISNSIIANGNSKKTESSLNSGAILNLQDFEKTITKNATADDLEKITNELAEKDFSVEFSNLEYNSAKEITGITIKYGGPNSNSGTYSVSSENPINTIVISSKNGGISLNSVGSNGNSAIMSQGGDVDTENKTAEIEMEFKKRREEMEAKRKLMRVEMAERRKEMQEKMDGTTEKNEKNEAEYQAKRKAKMTTKNLNSTQLNKYELKEFYENSEIKPYIIVNGIESSEAEMKSIEPSAIESVNILKEKNAVALYGEKAKNGAIIVTTRIE